MNVLISYIIVEVINLTCKMNGIKAKNMPHPEKEKIIRLKITC
jgi:hypothetical protein